MGNISAPRKRTANPRCTACDVVKTDENAYRGGEVRKDGTRRFRALCRACGYTPQKREQDRLWKERRRRASGKHRLGEKPVCKNGHPRTPENRRPSRYDCKLCHRAQERARQHKAGVKPLVPRAERAACSEGHILTAENRRKGRHAGDCLLCHRIRQRRDYDRTAKDWIAVIVNDPCCYCGDPIGGTIDHIVPVKAGGSDEWMNLTGSCFSCNAQKRTIPLLQFLLRRSHRGPA